MKGLSFNITLSDEQILEIAKTTAKEVQFDRGYYVKENENLYKEIEELRNQLQNKDDLILRQVSRNDMLHERIKKKNEVIEGLRKEIEDLKETL